MPAKPVRIPIDGYHIQADLYLQTPIAPIIVMAHGLGGEKSCGLDLYFDFFVAQGYSVCCFDHRGFGQSTGKVKNLVDKTSQLNDWQTVIDYLKTTYHLSEKQLILWGYSFSGGHVLTLASQHEYLAVIANFPHVDGVASVTKFPLTKLLPAGKLAIQDLLYSTVGKTKTMPVVAQDRFAVLSGKDCYDGYYSIIPNGTQWDNQVPARIIATIGLYRPIATAHKITTPTLLIGAKNDSLIPIRATRKTAKQSDAIEYLELDCGHFDMFHSPFINQIQQRQLAFLSNITTKNNQ